jgi:16S rRNA (cytidine1402-2'-O)-methyltransferase
MLYLIATPIGNLEDITLRALRVLKEVDFILAEDTRQSGILLKHFGIDKPMRSFYDHNEAQKVPEVVQELKSGKNIALISSAGSPTISDPGYRLVRECLKEKVAFTSVPGPSSVINALALSNVPHDKFLFIGYLPRKSGQRKKLFQKASATGAAIVFLESPFRLLSALEDIKESIGSVQLTITREMTKKFEQILDLKTDEAIEYFKKNKPLGEFVIIINIRENAELTEDNNSSVPEQPE